MNCITRFESLYHKAPEGTLFCPYRICPIGAHVDHQFGKITGFAIDKGIHIAYSTKLNGIVELVSMQFPKRAQWHVHDVPQSPRGGWADYLRGATLMLSRKYPLTYGISAVIDGDLPIGGLSSSAAVTLAFISALCHVNSISLSEEEIIDTAFKAESEYVGVSVGKLDQSCEVYSRSGQLLYLDTLDGSYELIPAPAHMKPWKPMIFFSGLERSLVGSQFNMRVDEVQSAAYALKAYAGIPYGKFRETKLREVPRETFENFKHMLPNPWRERAEHFYTEYARVEAGVRAWREGDIELYGKLSSESGASSIHNWQTGSPELKDLYEIIVHQDGVYGGRFCGAGFKGFCMALVDPSYEENIAKNVREAYLKLYPALEEKYLCHICETVDGVAL